MKFLSQVLAVNFQGDILTILFFIFSIIAVVVQNKRQYTIIELVKKRYSSENISQEAQIPRKPDKSEKIGSWFYMTVRKLVLNTNITFWFVISLRCFMYLQWRKGSNPICEGLVQDACRREREEKGVCDINKMEVKEISATPPLT